MIFKTKYVRNKYWTNILHPSACFVLLIILLSHMLRITLFMIYPIAIQILRRISKRKMSKYMNLMNNINFSLLFWYVDIILRFRCFITEQMYMHLQLQSSWFKYAGLNVVRHKNIVLNRISVCMCLCLLVCCYLGICTKRVMHHYP